MLTATHNPMPFDAWKTITTRELVRRGSMDRPSDDIRLFPTQADILNRIQQVRNNAIPTPPSSLRNPRVQGVVPSVPKPVTGVRITRTQQAGGSILVGVSFNRNTADPAFQNANVYLKQGSGTPNIVAVTGGTQTSFTVPATPAASVVTVQSSGTTGSLPLSQSPSRALTLRQK